MNSPALLLLLHLLVAFLAIASLLAILFPRRPLLGVPQHWGLQLWQLGLVALIGAILRGDWIAAALSLAVAAYWSWRLWPRKAAPALPESKLPESKLAEDKPAEGKLAEDRLAEGGPLLRLAAANLLHKNTGFARMIDGLSDLDADVLALCEVTPEARKHLRGLETRFPHALDTCAGHDRASPLRLRLEACLHPGRDRAHLDLRGGQDRVPLRPAEHHGRQRDGDLRHAAFPHRDPGLVVVP